MFRYIIKRIFQMIPLLIIISFIAFGIIRIAEVFANADPLTQMKMNPSVTDETIALEKQRMGFERIHKEKVDFNKPEEQDSSVNLGLFGWSQKATPKLSANSYKPDKTGVSGSIFFGYRSSTTTSLNAFTSKVKDLANNKSFKFVKPEENQQPQDLELKSGEFTISKFQFHFSKEDMNKNLQIDYPIPNGFFRRYMTWGSGFLRGDLGESFYYKTSVVSLILSRLWNTVTLGFATVVVTWFVAIPLGIWLAVRQYSLADQVFSSISYFFMGFPDFFLAILLLLFAAYTGLFPIGGMTNPENSHLKKIEEINQGIYTYPANRQPSAEKLKADEETRLIAKQQLVLDELKQNLKKELHLKNIENLSSITTQKVVNQLEKLNDQFPAEMIAKAKDEFKSENALSIPLAKEILELANSKTIFSYGQKWGYWFSHLGDLFYHYSRHIPDVLHHLVLPTLTLALISIASLQRRMRANLLDILGEEYIKTARAKGLSENKVIYKHAVRNAINPIITLLGFEIAGLISGAAFVEIIFSWPGLGNMMLQAILGNDLNLALAGLMSGAFMLLIGNLLADLLLAAVDPRIKLEA